MSSRARTAAAIVTTLIAITTVAIAPLALRRDAHADPPSRVAAIASVNSASSAPPDPSTSASSSPPSSNAPTSSARCNEQHADPALIRRNYIPIGGSPEDVRRRREAHAAAIRLRSERYGYFEGFGNASMNPHPPSFYTEVAQFMGLPVRVNRAIVPALACVERDIATRCAATPYRPRHLEGLRPANSFRGGEVSNHVYGIAVDIDPQRNPCCGCGTMFANHPGCTRHANTVFERMEMPPCWIESFERYGFYWLGNDHQLRDLMHFEFLADPVRIAG